MPHLRLAALAALPLLVAGSPLTETESPARTLLSGGEERAYYLHLPKDLGTDAPAPLLVVLHGSGGRGKLMVQAWDDLADQEGFFVVGPSSKNPQLWEAPVDGPAFLHDLVETLKRRYPIDPRRVYLFGHSGGAVFSLQMSLLESRYFAAAALHAGAFSRAEYRLMDKADRKIPLYIVTGTADEAFPLDYVRATRDALRSRQFPVEMTEVRNHTHEYYERARWINRQVWQFLSRHRLPGEPQYEQWGFHPREQPRPSSPRQQSKRGSASSHPGR
jgi:poly(3-hydroxybutyrate) depolymerase